MKVALVHDYLFEQGGAENVFEVLLGMFPEAPVYTSIYAPETMSDAFRARDIHTSFLQRITTRKRLAKALLPLYPLAFRSMQLRGYDLVLSSASSFAKAINVGGARHVCYCHTPPRFLWQTDRYIGSESSRAKRQAIRLITGAMRAQDRHGADNVDLFIANSRLTQQRIRRQYGRDSVVIHPPIRVAEFEIAAEIEPYFLVVSRLLPYKRIDIVVEACTQQGIPLEVIGDGPDRARLEALAGPTITFHGRLPRPQVRHHLARCRALIVAGEEDFGLTPLEANASGRPVIAYRAGGALETVVEGATGWYFDEQSVESLAPVLERVAGDGGSWQPNGLRAYAQRFDITVFTEAVRAVLDKGSAGPG